MTFHQIAWDHIDHLNRASIAAQVAQFSIGVKLGNLPADVVERAKGLLLDAMGCAIRGRAAPECRIAEDVATDLGGTPEAVIIGSGIRTNAACATLVNSVAVTTASGSFSAKAVPSLLAVGQRMKSNGRDLLAATVVAHELCARYSAAVQGLPVWSLETGAIIVVPAAVGKLMNLTEDQIANAIGSCAAGSASLKGSEDGAATDDPTDCFRFGWVAYAGIIACQLSSHGFSGPPRVIEGVGGVNEVMFKGRMDFDRLLDFRGWRIRELAAAGNGVDAYAAFQRAADGILPVDKIERVVDVIRNLESVEDVGELSQALVF